ncbi:MAG: M48 family metallopeptidase [Bdellovibrionales bacterium]|nr:M48 family metallopeptidase [Bdellovibrionales bacterium]
MSTLYRGSGGSDGVVCFNSDLLFKRKELQTYVIVHELLHLKIPNHGKLFQALMNLYMPNWKALDKELNCIKRELSRVNLPTSAQHDAINE